MFKPYSYIKNEDYGQGKVRIKPNVEPVISTIRSLAVHTVFAIMLLAIGFFVMTTKVLMPVVKTQANTEDYTPIISPLPTESASNLSGKVDDHFTFKEFNAHFKSDVEYVSEDGILHPVDTDAKKDENLEAPESEENKYFYLSIPSLDIKDAKVEINSTNLDPKKALGHYKGSCLPDEACNVFIFGHSSYENSPNRYEKGDYTTIFSKLNELKYGDEFSIKYDGKEYRYIVDITKVDRPENIDPLGQPLPKSLGKHDSTVELFTCTPPGTTKYRLSVIGKLVR